MGVHHLGKIHAVDIVRTDDDDVIGLLVIHDVQGLVDRIGAAEVPVRPAALLGGHWRDEIAQERGGVPGLRDVAVQGVGLVLGEDDDLEIPGVHNIRQSEINEPVVTTEGDCGLGTIIGEGHQALAFAASENDSKDVVFGHAPRLRAHRRISQVFDPSNP